MDTNAAILVFDALAQPTRLATFRLLVRHAPDGFPAGEVSNQLNIKQNTMSTHLGILARAGLVEPRRVGRSIRYHARLDQVRALSLFLLKDCCGGDAELCRPIVAELMPCC